MKLEGLRKQSRREVNGSKRLNLLSTHLFVSAPLFSLVLVDIEKQIANITPVITQALEVVQSSGLMNIIVISSALLAIIILAVMWLTIGLILLVKSVRETWRY